MNSVSKYVLIVSVLILFIFGYLFYRDVYIKPSSDLNISECIPFDVIVDEDIIKWRTVEDCVGYVKYGYDKDSLELIAVNEKESSGFNHTVEIGELEDSAYAVIYSNGVAYGNSGEVLRIK